MPGHEGVVGGDPVAMLQPPISQISQTGQQQSQGDALQAAPALAQNFSRTNFFLACLRSWLCGFSVAVAAAQRFDDINLGFVSLAHQSRQAKLLLIDLQFSQTRRGAIRQAMNA